MHCDQCIIKVGADLSTWCPFTENSFQEWECIVRITQLQAEQNREQGTNNRPGDPCDQKLFTDCFMVLAENIFGNETLFMMVMPITMVMYIMSHCFLMHMYC